MLYGCGTEPSGSLVRFTLGRLSHQLAVRQPDDVLRIRAARRRARINRLLQLHGPRSPTRTPAQGRDVAVMNKTWVFQRRIGNGHTVTLKQNTKTACTVRGDFVRCDTGLESPRETSRAPDAARLVLEPTARRPPHTKHDLAFFTK
ncbi:hypothetical protein EVAR_81793_1 [Eumeta japonica]|uniref:Uncharacterized protein n=1 Tax=Eumeta variegata TaxID=151549 RepID=A0A4C1UHL2_EUMVA|nr:hypothetical protein EVAR_81793_1 [Eumeta japonica]